MNTIQKTIDVIIAQGILPLYYNEDEQVTIEVLRAIYKGGIKAVEYTNRGENALPNFAKMIAIRDLEMPDMLLGIGTIKTLEQAQQYNATGADFFISPGFVPEVAVYLGEHGKLYSPGCMTPKEIIAAESAGIPFIKLFPGNALGPEFLSAVKDIFPKLLFMPTGGVDATRESIESWFKAGVSAVGMGSKLISKELMAGQAYARITADTVKVLDIIQTIKRK